MNYMRLRIVLLTLVILIIVGAMMFSAQNPQRRYISAQIGSQTFRLRVAGDAEERAQGLGGVAALTQNEGMLFAFPDDGLHGIWMKDMRIPIDILWLSNGFQVVDFAEKVSPDSFPRVFTPATPARFVVELSAGAKKASGVGLRDTVQLFEQ